jgi:diguanylate cyclase (GGDEF)-like protein
MHPVAVGTPGRDHEEPIPSAERGWDAVRASATARDSLATSRDVAADARDVAADNRDVSWDDEDVAQGRPNLTRVAYRADAHRDRESAADDRRAAALDRQAAADELALAGERIEALMHDRLTGFYQAGAGMLELEREVLRCQRNGELFTLVFVDVDGLKVVNDSEGHLAGDQLILVVADAIKAVLRDYDLVVRYGGDEFLCGMQGMTEAQAVERFEAMQERLLEQRRGTASVGIAELEPGESVRDVISRADRAMYVAKASRNSGRRRDHPPR